MEYDGQGESDEITEMFCELCKKKGKHRTAGGFCVTCVRYFCTECLSYHTEFLPDHVHQDKKQMPQDVCLEECPKHSDEIIKYYCSSCGNFFCTQCKKIDHDNCLDVRHLPVLADKLEQGREFKEFQQLMENFSGEISQIESKLESDMKSVDDISSRAVSKIESTKEQFIEALNKRVSTLKREVQITKERDQKAINEESSKLDVMKTQMANTKSTVERMLIEEKRCQLFMTMKDAKKNEKLCFDDLQKLKKREIQLYEFDEFKGTGRFLDNIKRFGRLNFERLGDSTKETKKEHVNTNIGTQIKGEMKSQGNEKCNRQDRSKLQSHERIRASNISEEKGEEDVNEKSTWQKTTESGATKMSPVKNDIPVKKQEALDVDTQRALIAIQLQQPLKRGEKWYIVHAKWFKQWKSYVGYESCDHYKVVEESSNPGPIDNRPLFQEGTTNLKEHLKEVKDYHLIPEEGWEQLVCWYGILDKQEPLPRRVIYGDKYTKSLKVEVYPWYLRLSEYSNQDYQVSKMFSRVTTIGELEEIMRDEFKIPSDKEVRLWNRYMTNMYKQLAKKDLTLKEAGLYLSQVIVIEQRNCDGTWPWVKSVLRKVQSAEI